MADLEESDWPEGLDRAQKEGVFVTPAVKGWVLVVGTGLLLRPPDVAALSAALDTEVQCFATHRVSESHRWERAKDGRLTRRFEFNGDSGTATHEGRATAVEKRLGIDRFSMQISAGDFDAIVEWPSEQTVLEVASAWSLNPSTMDELPIERRPGTWGRRS